MPFETDQRLKSYLDTNQLYREQMCRAILAADRRFSDVRPRHPRGGPDGGRDIEATYRDQQVAFGAVGFVNQANDSSEQKRTIAAKFSHDLDSAVSAKTDLEAFVFFTNVNLTVGEKDELVEVAKRKGLLFCEIFDRERLRIALDAADGFSTRFQFLNIPLSVEEQATFFARWGDDIQSIISTGFEKVQTTLHRLLFLQEVRDPLAYLTLRFELDRRYTAEEIGHFRLFCSMYLKEAKHKILSLFFGSTDKSNRMRQDSATDFTEQRTGIKYGVSGGQWEQHVEIEDDNHEAVEEEVERYTCVGSSSSLGQDSVEFLNVTYSKYSFIRFSPVLTLYDLDEAMFLPFCNESLATKVSSIHVFSNGYKLQEIRHSEFWIDRTEFHPNCPVEFSAEELQDPWVRLRPADLSSAFHLRFFESTPMRLSTPEPVRSGLDASKGPAHNKAMQPTGEDASG